MSDEAVKAKTGKKWDQWFLILDKAGAKDMSHKEIVKFLNSEHGVGPWWQQMVTVSYEQARGLRDKHEKPAGYEVSVSRTVKVPLAKLYKAIGNETRRRTWLSEEGLLVRKATPNKSMRVTWKDGKTSLEFYFSPKGDQEPGRHPAQQASRRESGGQNENLLGPGVGSIARRP